MCKTIPAVDSTVHAAPALTDTIIYCLSYTSTWRLHQDLGPCAGRNTVMKNLLFAQQRGRAAAEERSWDPAQLSPRSSLWCCQPQRSWSCAQPDSSAGQRRVLGRLLARRVLTGMQPVPRGEEGTRHPCPRLRARCARRGDPKQAIAVPRVRDGDGGDVC